MTDYDRLLPILLSAWRWATVPEASERDPRYVEVTEGRDTGAAYSSCRDIAHWGYEVIGVRLPWLLRASLGTWAYGRPVVTPGFEAFTGEVEPGDVLVVANDWPRGRDAHVVCVTGVTASHILTAEYGQPGGKAKQHPRGATMGGRKIQVRLSLRKVLATARAAGKLVDPTWPKRSDTEPAPPPSATPSGDAAGLLWPSVLEVWSAYSVPLEGSVPWMYLDVRGLVTTGVGCLLTGEDQAAHLGWVHTSGEPATVAEVRAEYRRVQAMPHGLVAVRYRGALRLPTAEVERLMLDRLGYAARAMAKAFPDWKLWPGDAQLAALSMAWACGTGWVGARWPRLTAACRARDWLRAATECRIREAGNPGVVPRNAQQRIAFRNADVVASNPWLRVSECYWPLALETDL